jgi:hypothetical protein
LQDHWQEYIQWTYEISLDLVGIFDMTFPLQELQRQANQPVTGPKLKNLLFPMATCASFTAHYAHFDQPGFEVRALFLQYFHTLTYPHIDFPPPGSPLRSG